VDGDTREVALAQELVEFRGAHGTLDEDDDLVELKAVEQLVQLTILLALGELDVELLKAVERQLSLIVDIDLERILHELLADRTGFLRERGAEHHHLLLGWCSAEDVLHIAAHVCKMLTQGTEWHGA
jgi:L-fucose isomerase-like protein